MCEYIAANLMDYLHLTFQPNLNPRGGVLPEKLGGAVWHASETLTLFQTKSVMFLTYFRPGQKFDALFQT